MMTKPPWLIDGYCAATATGKVGDCTAGNKGCFTWPPSPAAAPSGKLRGLQACVLECLKCARCNYVSFSRMERDCSWYHSCDLARLFSGTATGHASLRVRDGAGSTLPEIQQFLQPSQSSAAQPAQAPPRLVDLVIYGGVHHDVALEVRMHELSPLVGLFVVAEHVRPHGGAPAFSATRPRFERFANQTRHVLLPASTPKERDLRVPEFVDLEVQDYFSRQRALNSWQLAYAAPAVARDGDVVLVADADEVVRRASLSALLRDGAALAALADNQAFGFHGKTLDYHAGCAAGRQVMEAAASSPRLLAGEALLHFGGGNVRDYVGRVPYTPLPDAAWHLRYFASAAQLRGALCRHPSAGGIQDATQFWAPKPVMQHAATLCAQPERIQAAIDGCLDLWGRAKEAGTVTARAPGAVWDDRHDLRHDLPLLMRERPGDYSAARIGLGLGLLHEHHHAPRGEAPKDPRQQRQQRRQRRRRRRLGEVPTPRRLEEVQAAPGGPTGAIRVACMGDSITRGNASHEPGRGTHRPYKERTATRGNFPAELQALMGRRYEVRNFGHGGRSVVETVSTLGPRENVAYARTPEYRAAEKFAPSVVVLMLGTNDAKHCNPNEPVTQKSPPGCMPGKLGTVWSPRTFAPSLAALARTVLAWPSAPRMLLLAPPPVLPRAYAGSSINADILTNEVVPRIVAVGHELAAAAPARDACARGGVRTWSLHNGTWASCPAVSSDCGAFIDRDGVHTTEAGAAAIAHAVSRLLLACPAPSRDVAAGMGNGNGASRRARQRERRLFFEAHNLRL